jgi:integrase
MKLALTDKFCERAKPGEWFDETATGLALRVGKNRKTWTLHYTRNGKRGRDTIGHYPVMSLAVARRVAIEGPSDGGTFKAKAEEYLVRECGMKRDAEGKATFEGGNIRSGDQRLAVFERSIYPTLGERPFEEIKRSEIVSLLDDIEDERGPQAAHQALAFLSKLFNWYASRSDHFRSPIVRGMARIKPRERRGKRVLADDEIREIWSALDTAEVPAPFSRLQRTLFVTAVRRSEAARASWPEITDGLWTIPAERMKAKQDHVVPLTPTAIDLIGPKGRGRFIFSTDGGKTAFSGYSKAKAALDAEIAKRRKAQGREPMPPWTISRDVRRTCRTLMSRAGVASEHAERVVAHVIPGVEGVYDMWEYLEEKREALAKLAGLIGGIVDG